MEKGKKENQQFSIRMDKSIYEEFAQYCEDEGHTKTFVIEKALKEYLERHKNNQ